MITELDLNIYQAIFQQKKLTEKYIGNTQYQWIYSEVHYTAACTMGVPFDLFDKTITGILLVDEVLSIEEIGAILGMNLIHNPEQQQYKDDAEFDILRMALDSLYSYKMIEIGDASYSSCRLTSIGKEYAEKGRKFRDVGLKSFSLVYDHTSQNHITAKSLFRNIKGKNQPFLINDFDFLDENLMKQIAANQASEIYDTQKGNSFTNPSLDPKKSLSFKLQLNIALVYDLENGNIRLLAYEPTTKTINKYFSEWLNANKLKEIIAQFQSENAVDNSLPILPQSYIQTLKNLDKELGENPKNASEIAKNAHQNLDYVNVEYFWNNLSNFISETTKEFWFLLQNANQKNLTQIEKLAAEYPNTYIFVALNSQIKNIDFESLNTKSKLIGNNIFSINIPFKIIKNPTFWVVSEYFSELVENHFQISGEYNFSSLLKINSSTKPPIYSSTKKYFAKMHLPAIKEEVQKIIAAKENSLLNNENSNKTNQLNASQLQNKLTKLPGIEILSKIDFKKLK